MGVTRAALLCLVALAAPMAVWALDGSEAALGDLLKTRSLRGARVGIAVADLETGEILLEQQASRPMVPASNQKLLTAAAALRHWGPTHRFATPILIEAPLGPDGVVEGPLWIVGRGDPSLVSESLWKLAEELYLLGLREVRGGIAVDLSFFDGQTTHPDWEPVSSRAYHARVSAFAANYSSFRIEVAAATEPGQPAIVSFAPNVPYFRVRTRAPTIARKAPLLVDVDRLPDGSGETIRVSGAVALGSKPETYWRSVSLPERYAVSILKSQLQAQGVRVSGPVRFGKAPTDAVELMRFEGASVGEIVQRLNKFSNNFIAEQLIKLLGAERGGAPGSWQQGTDSVRELLLASGAIDKGTVIADGSGLSPRNRVSPASLVRVILQAATDFESGPEFMSSLPLGGLDGTLEDRMNGGPIALRGKTGHLRHVASLSGLMSRDDGHRLAFSIMINGGRGGREEVDDAIDAFVTQIAEVAAPAAAQGESGD